MSDVKITETSKLAVQGDVNESFKLKRGAG